MKYFALVSLLFGATGVLGLPRDSYPATPYSPSPRSANLIRAFNTHLTPSGDGCTDPERSSTAAAFCSTPEEYATLFVCKDIHFAGTCHCMELCMLPSEEGCYELPNYLVKEVSSARALQGVKCVFYKNGVCRDFGNGDGTLTVTHNGTDNFVDVQGAWNDAAVGFRCFRE